MFDVVSYLDSLNLNTQSRSRGHYLYIDCPECDSGAPHLWINIGDESRPYAAWGCWKNASHHGGPKKLIVHLEKVGWWEAEERLQRFSTETQYVKEEVEEDMEIKEIELPKGKVSRAIESGEAMRFLEHRGFGSRQANDWDLYYADFTRQYRKRLIIPIEFQGRLVGFQARDVTDRQKAKYLSSPDLPKSRILYNADRVDPKLVVVTEGPLDAWAVGKEHGVCIFGKKVSAAQARILYEMIGAERVVVALDGEAYGEAEAMAMDLVGSVPRVDALELPCREDPASLGHERIWELIK